MGFLHKRGGRIPRRWARLVGVVLMLAVTGAGVWLSRRGAQSREISPLPERPRKAAPTIVETVRPRAGGIQRTIQQPATILAFETVDLFAMVSGYLKSQAVDIGSRIRKGDVLAEIDVPRDAKAVEEAASLVEQARARIVQANAQIKVAESQQSAFEAAASQAASDVDRVKAERILAEKQLARISGLVAERAADQRLVDEQQSRLDAARAAERTAEIAVRTARARALAAAAEVEKAKADASQARASLGVAESSHDRLRVNLRYARIVAPFDGVVTLRTFHPGALIHSAMGGGEAPLLTVKRTDRMRVVVLVPDRDVVWTKVGDRAVVSVDALDGRHFDGTLARIARSEDAERMMRVEIDLPNPDDSLYDGMYGKATITLGRNPRSLAVPPTCFFDRIGRSRGVVYVVKDSTARRAEVRIGSDNGSMVEVLSGIGVDDLLIKRSGASIEDGMPIALAK